MFEEAPLCVKVLVPLRHTAWTLLISIDSRIGHIVATVAVDCLGSGVKVALETLEREVAENKNALPAQLTMLQLVMIFCPLAYDVMVVLRRCQLFLASVEEKACEQGLRVRSVPLLKPLPFPPDTKTLFVELQPLAYLVVAATPHPQFTDSYYVLQVATGDEVTVPQCFFAATNLDEIDPTQAVLSHMKAITGMCCVWRGRNRSILFCPYCTSVTSSGHVLKRKVGGIH